MRARWRHSASGPKCTSGGAIAWKGGPIPIAAECPKPGRGVRVAPAAPAADVTNPAVPSPPRPHPSTAARRPLRSRGEQGRSRFAQLTSLQYAAAGRFAATRNESCGAAPAGIAAEPRLSGWSGRRRAAASRECGHLLRGEAPLTAGRAARREVPDIRPVTHRPSRHAQTSGHVSHGEHELLAGRDRRLHDVRVGRYRATPAPRVAPMDTWSPWREPRQPLGADAGPPTESRRRPSKRPTR